jgi:hypothetical protein
VLTPSNLGKLVVTPAGEQKFSLNMLIYGRSGVGKTRLAASASEVPEMSPVLLIDVEGGTFSIRDVYPDVDVLRVRDWLEMQEVYNQLYDGKHPYKTVILDSLTEMQKFSMMNIMIELLKDPRNSDRDPDIPSIREWGKNIEQIRKMVRAFRDLPISTIFTALVVEDKNQKTGAIEKRPSLSGKLSGEVAGFLDIVSYYYVKPVPITGTTPVQYDQQRLLLSTATEDIVAKDRSDRLPTVVQKPTMAVLLDYITGKQQTETP